MPSSLSKSTGTYVALAAGATVATYAYKSRNQQIHDDKIDLKNQTVEIDPVEHIRRCTFYKDIDINTYYNMIYPNVQTLGDAFYNGYHVSNNGPCVTDVDLSNKVSPCNWISYSMALERIRYIGSHFVTETKLIPLQSKIAIMSPNRPEFTFVEYACYMYGFIISALYTSYDSTTVLSMLKRTEAEVLVVDNIDRIKSIKDQLLQDTQIKEILVMDEFPNNENKKVKSIPAILKTMQQGDVRPLPKIDPETVCTFILTSGTTGKKK
jgi:non-ribosomal peptide synthetase component E (peptide arylation enzyme)